MFIEVGIIVTGVPFGYLLRNNKTVIKVTNLTLVWSVRSLLFLLGLSLGSDVEIMSKLDTIGIRAAIIGILCLAGSLLGTKVIEKFIILPNKSLEKQKKDF